MADGGAPIIPATIQAADFVTVLRSYGGRRLTKAVCRKEDGSLELLPYEDAKTFDMRAEPVNSLADLQRVVTALQPNECIIVGKLIDGVDPEGARRVKRGDAATIEDAAHLWLPVDADGIQACDDGGEFNPIAEPERAVRLVLTRLPEACRAADVFWMHTSSAGFKPTEDGKPAIRMRLYFWLSRPLSNVDMAAWLSGVPGIDASIYRANQPIYAAAPVLTEGIADPVPQRSGVMYAIEPGVPWPVVPPLVIERVKAERPAHAGPENIEYDVDATIEWAKGVIAADVAEHGEPVDGGYSDNRCHGLIGTLRDGPKRGQSLSNGTITDLLHEQWAPHFDWDWIVAKVENGSWQNGPGVGPAGSAERKYGSPNDYAPYREEGKAGLGDKEPDGRANGKADQWPEIRNARRHLNTVFPAHQWAWKDRLLAYRPNLITGVPGAGKTTFAANESVAFAAGIPLLGAETMPMSVFLLCGEDPDATIRDNIRAIRHGLGVDETVLDRIDWLCTLGLDIPGGPLLATIDENGKVQHSKFMTECIIPKLLSYAGPVLFIVDPLAPFLPVDRNKPLPAGAVGRRWGEDICRINNGQVTLQVNDHPSNAAVDSGRHVSGDVQFRGGFAFTATIKKKERATVEGISQREYEYETLKARHADESVTVYYRIGDSPAYRRQPAQDLALSATMARVYKHIEDRRGQGVRSFATNGNGKTERHGPDIIAAALGLPVGYVKDAIRRLVQLDIYRNQKAETGGSQSRDPGGIMLGAFACNFPMSDWSKEMFIEVNRPRQPNEWNAEALRRAAELDPDEGDGISW